MNTKALLICLLLFSTLSRAELKITTRDLVTSEEKYYTPSTEVVKAGFSVPLSKKREKDWKCWVQKNSEKWTEINCIYKHSAITTTETCEDMTCTRTAFLKIGGSVDKINVAADFNIILEYK
jgi:hypothetical protein